MRLALRLVLAFCFGQVAWAVDLPVYQPVKLEAHKLSLVGSDSMDDLIGHWVEAYKKYQPEVTVQVITQGSATAAPALIEGSADLAPMSRPMKSEELEDFKIKFGFEPTQVRTGIAAVAVYVSEKNPLDKISFDELDALFSSEQKRGGKDVITKWGDLRVQGSLAEQPVMLLGVDHGSYSYLYFKQSVLLQGGVKSEIITTVDVKSLFATLNQNPNAIAFGPFVEAFKGVKALAVSRKAGQVALKPTKNNIVSEEYPLARFLSMYIMRYPERALDSATKDFLRFVLSEEGQKLVAKESLMPLPVAELQKELKKLD